MRLTNIGEVVIITIAFTLALLPPELSSADAAGGCIALGSTYRVSEEEVRACNETTHQICIYAALYGGYDSYHLYGEETTKTAVLDAAAGCVGDNCYTFTIVFYVGHGYRRPDDGHMYILDDDGENVWDHEIYEKTESRNVRFAFLWSCYQGYEKGGWDEQGRAYGMPLAWLHDINISENGYEKPDGKGYVFIGWRRAAPYLTWNNNEGKRFLQEFFYYAFKDGYKNGTYYHRSIHEALDEASQKVWGVEDFKDSPYNKGFCIGDESTRLRVYGDGNMTIDLRFDYAPGPPPPPPPHPPPPVPYAFMSIGRIVPTAPQLQGSEEVSKIAV